MTIRPATPADVPALVRLGRAQLAASYGDAVADVPDVLATFFTALVTAPTAAVWLAVDAATPVGMIGLLLAPHPLSGVPTASEVTWYVAPEARGTRTGLALLRHGEQWAAERGAAVLQVMAPATEAGARVGQLYTRRGYRPLETCYQRPVAPPVSALVVVDDVLPDYPRYVATARAQPFGDVTVAPGVTFHGIAPAWDTTLMDTLRARWPALAPTFTRLRQSPAGQAEPTTIHTDVDMGEWTAILYLTDTPPPEDGTTFWTWRATGARVTTAMTAEDRAVELAAWRDPAQWDPWTTVAARPNRLVLFPARYFHSRALPANYGTGAAARLIQITFGTGAVPPAGGVEWQ